MLRTINAKRDSEILEFRVRGFTLADIAHDYDLSVSRIREILARQVRQVRGRANSGGDARFYATELAYLLENYMCPVLSSAFINEMNRLTQLWAEIMQKNETLRGS